jgi:phosphate acyltransferase
MVRIAVDAMGGDMGAAPVVEGALAAARHLDIALLLVGDARTIEPMVARDPAPRVRVVDAPDVVAMHESPTEVRRRPNASIRVAAGLVAADHADALVSVGHTGATVMAAHAAFGLIAGIERPALATIVPTMRGGAVLLDAGATVSCRPVHLLQFGVMGSRYARLALALESPRVGLLSVGEEAGKGNDLTREAHGLLAAAPLRFVGNVEGRDVYSGAADVIVCDGFTGNVVLKTSEGLVEMVEERLREELAGTFSSQVGWLLSRRAFRRFRKRVDYSEYGGVPLLGVARPVIVGHGRSSAKAVRNAVAAASRFVRTDFAAAVAADVSTLKTVGA